MIYLKKPDGTIQQYEIEGTDEERQLREGLNIDRQLYAQRGVELGEIYDDNTLLDADKVTVGLMTQAEYFLKLQNAKLNEIIFSFDSEIAAGHFASSALGIDVDCRRSGLKNDLQNVQGLISYMSRKSISSIEYVGYSETITGVTVSMLESLCAEMEDYVLALYQKKWSLEVMVAAAKTETELKAIAW
jgi:hypothetical protein